jgi:hypothetical protein
MTRSFCVLALFGCTYEASPSEDLSPIDFSGAIPETLCTTSACANQPCTAGCVFEPTTAGCTAQVKTARVMACPGWCGLQQVLPYGCLRYRSEDPRCPTWCVSWGDAACWEQTPMTDYSTGGAICPAGSGCFGGYPLADSGVACVDGGLD